MKCACGHTDHWHSHGGAGSCEHDAECSCRQFEQTRLVIWAFPAHDAVAFANNHQNEEKHG